MSGVRFATCIRDDTIGPFPLNQLWGRRSPLWLSFNDFPG